MFLLDAHTIDHVRLITIIIVLVLYPMHTCIAVQVFVHVPEVVFVH